MRRPIQYLSGGRPSRVFAAGAAAVLLSCMPVREAHVSGGEGVPGWKDFFPAGSAVHPVSGLKAGEEAYEVLGKGGEFLGWVFRTDRVDPPVKGLVDQIGVLVAVSSDRRIIGVRLLEHGDTPSYMENLTDEFYGQFRGRSIDDGWTGVDTVTGATVSSSAVARGVFLSCRRLFSVVGSSE